MLKKKKLHIYKPYKAKPPGSVKRLMTRGENALKRVFRMPKKKNRNRKPYAVSSRYQLTWKLQRFARSMVVCLTVAALIAGTGWFSFLLLKNSDVFLVTSVDVQGNSVVSKKQVLVSAGLNRSINLLELDIAEVKNNIQSHSWIESVGVKRRWPSSVEIIVREHKPLALFNLDENGQGKLYYVDAKGYVFTPITVAKDLDFPVLTGRFLSEDLHEMQVQKETLADLGLQVMRLAARGNQILSLQAISEIHIDRERGVILYLVDHPFPIYMGKENIRNRFNLLVRVLAQLYRQDKVKEVAEIRMDYAEDRIMVAGIGAS